jgi:uncharacterized protein
MKIIAIEEHFSSQRFLGATGGPGGPRMGPDVHAKLLDLGESRIADMDAAGIDMQVLSLSVPGLQQLEPATAVPLAREENDRLAEAVGRHPDRLAGFAALPTADPEAASREFERATGRLGFKGALIHGHTRGRFLDEGSFWPILECAEALQVPIYLHPTPPPRAVAEAYYSGLPSEVGGLLATSAWGWHIDTGLQVLRLIVAGVFDRFRGLQLVVGHAGEALPFMLARTTAVLPAAITKLQRPISEYFQENIHVTTSGFFTVPPLLNALLVLGADRLIFSIDYPFADNASGRAFLDSMPVSPTDRARIAHGNAERLLRL